MVHHLMSPTIVFFFISYNKSVFCKSVLEIIVHTIMMSDPSLIKEYSLFLLYSVNITLH